MIYTIDELKVKFNFKDTKALIKKINFKNKDFTKIKRGLYYCFNESNNDKKIEEISYALKNDSYISWLTAMYLHWIIKNYTDYNYFSVTDWKTKKFKNSLWDFYYRKIKNDFYFWFETHENNWIKYNLATKEKALFDFIYFEAIDYWKLNKKDIEIIKKEINNDNLFSLTENLKDIFDYFVEIDKKYDLYLEILDYEKILDFTKDIRKNNVFIYKVYVILELLKFYYYNFKLYNM